MTDRPGVTGRGPGIEGSEPGLTTRSRDGISAFGALALRSLLRQVRNPQPLVVTLAFPAIFLAIAESSFGDAAMLLPRFGADSYLQFAIAGTLVLSAVSAGVNAGADLALDLQSGRMDRILLAPRGRRALLAGIVAGPVVMVVAQAVAYLAGLALAGDDFAGGLAGQLALVGLVAAVAAAFAAVGATIALMTGSAQVVLASFPAFFVVMTFSSFFLPRHLIPAAWFRGVALVNPMSSIIEAGRSLAVDGWRLFELARGTAVVAATLLVATRAAEAALRRRARGS
jgi:ABC-type multidrug transport system permease subunit